MVAISSGPTAAEILIDTTVLQSGSTAAAECTTGITENIDAVEELVLSQEDAIAPETHRTVRHFEYESLLCIFQASSRVLLCYLESYVQARHNQN